MPFNIMDAANEYMAPEVISKVSSFLHEDENNVRKATDGIIPIVLYGFAVKGATSPDHADDIMEIGKAAYSNNNAARLDIFLADGGTLIDKGLRLMQALFGNKLGSLMSQIASFSGIRISSAGSLFSIAGPFVVSELGKYALTNNLNIPEFTSFLNRQRLKSLNYLPEDLYDVTGLLGISNNGRDNIKAKAIAKQLPDEKPVGNKKLFKVFFWLFLFAVASLSVYFFLVQ